MDETSHHCVKDKSQDLEEGNRPESTLMSNPRGSFHLCSVCVCVCVVDLQGEVVYQAANSKYNQQQVGENEGPHGVGHFLDLSISFGCTDKDTADLMLGSSP